MIRYVIRRLAHGSLAVLGLMLVVFILARTTGNPLDLILPIDAAPEMRAQLSKDLGLDRGILQQFFIYLAHLAQADLGTSIRYKIPVWTLFLDNFPNTLGIVIPAFLVSIAVGVPVGVLSATARSIMLRRALSVFALLGMAVPTFWLGIMLIFVFSVQLGWLPTSQMGGPLHFIMPVVTLAAFLIAGILRLVRSQMLDVLDSEYIKLARMKGLSERVVIWKHALLNSISAASSFMSVFVGVLIMGSVVVETVFAWPGTGRLLYNGITGRDYPVVQGLVLMSSLFIISINLGMDILQAVLDPRIRR